MGRHSKFVKLARSGGNMRGTSLIHLCEDPITKDITLPDGTPLYGKPVHTLPAIGDLQSLEKIAETRAKKLSVPQDYGVGVYFKQVDVLDSYDLLFYFIRKHS